MSMKLWMEMVIYGIGEYLSLIFYLTDALSSGERQLKLPQTKLQNASVRSVTPDAVDLIACPDHPAYRDGLKARESLSCFYQLEPPQSLFVIHCVADYKQNSSGQLESQAIVGVVSGLYQRKLLGGTNQFVFGLIRRSVHFLQVIAAIWWEGKVDIGSIRIILELKMIVDPGL